MHLFSVRRDEEEWMDLPSTTRLEFIQALYDIQWVNRKLGGISTLLEEFERLIPSDFQTNFRGTLSVLDLGTGSADIPRALVEWSRALPHERRINLAITAVDLHPVAVEISRQLSENYPEISIVQADALTIAEPDQSFDIVISSMFMHHLQHKQAVRLLQEMARLSRLGFIVNDLQRHPFAWAGIKVLGMLTGKGKIFKNDAPLSVLRGFTRADLQVLRQDAQLPTLRIRHRKPYRWLLSWQRPLPD
jgi:SAM-dependent methyltransferase